MAWRDQAQAISSRLHLDPVDWYREQAPVPLLGVVAEAVWHARRLAVRYDSWKRRSARTVGPLGLVLKAGTWYLVALVGDQPRTFRVANLHAAELLPASVQRPARFDLAAYWAESIRRFERTLYTAEATVLTTPAGLEGLSHLSNAVAKAVAGAAPSRRQDGRIRLRLPIESIEHATGQLLRLAPDVEALEPVALRAAVIERLQRIAGLYRVSSLARGR